MDVYSTDLYLAYVQWYPFPILTGELG